MASISYLFTGPTQRVVYFVRCHTDVDSHPERRLDVVDYVKIIDRRRITVPGIAARLYQALGQWQLNSNMDSRITMRLESDLIWPQG